MKERSILMSGPMVKAILENRKTQTRRVLKPQRPDWWPDYCAKAAAGYSLNEMKLFYPNGKPALLPYGIAGDSVGLWVRETWTQNVRDEVLYKADWQIYENKGMGWKSPIYMPRWASRLTLEVTGVRVERLNSISAYEAEAEGINVSHYYCDEGTNDDPTPIHRCDPIGKFRELWDSINGKRTGCSWQENPWVFVISFKRKD